MSASYEIIPGQNPDNTLACPICYEKITHATMIPDCEDVFCTECLKAFLSDRISQAKVAQIPCPKDKCNTIISKAFIEQILSPEIVEKYNKFNKRDELAKNPLIRFCPQTDCEGYDIGGNKKVKLTCNLCRKYFCFTCNERWHEKEKCKDIVNVEFEKYVREKNVKFCPKCGKRVEKQGGCLHMTCICGFIWCWRCGSNPFVKNHVIRC